MTTDRQVFYDLDDFPRLKEVADSWSCLHNEFSRLRAPDMPIDRQGKSHAQVRDEVISHITAGGEYGWLLGWGQDRANKDWMQYGLIAGGTPLPWAAETMPKTVGMLGSVDGIQTAALSRLAKNTLLPTHTHPDLAREGLLQMHVTLTEIESRNYAYFNVSGQFRHYSSRNAFVFDGSNDHFAVNASSEDRVILYLEFYKDKLYRPVSRA